MRAALLIALLLSACAHSSTDQVSGVQTSGTSTQQGPPLRFATEETPEERAGAARAQADRDAYGAKYASSCPLMGKPPKPPEPPNIIERAKAIASALQVVEANQRDVRACYDEALPGWGNVRGEMSFGVATGPDGSVLSVYIEENTSSVEPLACCIAARIRTWRFDTPEARKTTLPIRLQLPPPTQAQLEARAAYRLKHEPACEPSPPPRPAPSDVEPPNTGFDMSHVVRGIKGRLRDVQRCYEQALRGWPQSAGRVRIEFRVTTQGTVDAAAPAENTTGVNALGCCIAGAIESLTVTPAPGASIAVSYPFDFRPIQ